MKYADFAAFWTYSWLFLAYDNNDSGLVDDLKIMEGTQKWVSVVPLNGD